MNGKQTFSKLIISVSLLFTESNTQSVQASDYFTITQRNVFRLKTVEINATNHIYSAPPQLDVKLTGISIVEGKKRAWLAISTRTTQELPKYLNLQEGERDDFLEVFKISEQVGEVEVLKNGIRIILKLKVAPLGNSLTTAPIIQQSDRDVVPARKFPPIIAGVRN